MGSWRLGLTPAQFRGRFPVFSHADIFRSCPVPRSTKIASFAQIFQGTVFPATFAIFVNQRRDFTGSTMAIVCLDSQVFYKPPAAEVPKPVSRGFQVRNGNPSAAILGPPLRLPLPQDAHDAQYGLTGESWHHAVLIPSDDEPDDNVLVGGLSDMSFPPLDEFLPTACKELESRSVVSAGMCLNLASLGGECADMSQQAIVSMLLPTTAMRRSFRSAMGPA